MTDPLALAWRVSLMLFLLFVVASIIVSSLNSPDRAIKAMWITTMLLFSIFLILVIVWLIVKGKQLSKQLDLLERGGR